MFESDNDGLAVADFDDMADQLLEQGHHISPAQIHGCLSAVLAGAAAPEPEHGLAVISKVLETELHGDLAEQVINLHRATAAALVDEEFGYHPLLPDDETDLAVRVAALSQWSSGFIAGFALVAGKPAASDGDVTEILEDIAAMAEADVDDDAGEDESEGSYTELVEYLRFSVLNIHAQFEAAAADEGDTSLH